MMKKICVCVLCIISMASVGQADQRQDNKLLIPTGAESVFVISSVTGTIIPIASRHRLMIEPRQHVHTAVRSNQGMTFPLENRQPEYLQAKIYGLEGRQRIAEEIGDAGARHYARSVGYTPLYQGKPGQGQGFDHVYRAGKRIVVIEIKGGTSPLKLYHGAIQGTRKYVRKVAEATLRSPVASMRAKQAAKEVLHAYNMGRLDIEVVTTKHVQGKPRATYVKTVDGHVPKISALSTLHKISLYSGGLGAILGGGFDLVGQMSSDQNVNWKRVGHMSVLGGVSGYAGTMTGSFIQHTLMSNSHQLLSKLAVSKIGSFLGGGLGGSFITSALFSYGAYFLGYSDLRTANRNMLAATAGSAIGTLGGATAIGLVATFGSASTGTAISTLSGAAATNTTLAWFGGGAIAAGGGGMTVGAAVLTGGVALVAIAVGAGAMYWFHLEDEEAERERMDHLVESIMEHLNQKVLSYERS